MANTMDEIMADTMDETIWDIIGDTMDNIMVDLSMVQNKEFQKSKTKTIKERKER